MAGQDKAKQGEAGHGKARHIGKAGQCKAPRQGRAKHLGKQGRARQGKAPRQVKARHLRKAPRQCNAPRQGS
jgi:hypothetical protein